MRLISRGHSHAYNKFHHAVNWHGGTDRCCALVTVYEIPSVHRKYITREPRVADRTVEIQSGVLAGGLAVAFALSTVAMTRRHQAATTRATDSRRQRSPRTATRLPFHWERSGRRKILDSVFRSKHPRAFDSGIHVHAGFWPTPVIIAIILQRLFSSFGESISFDRRSKYTAELHCGRVLRCPTLAEMPRTFDHRDAEVAFLHSSRQPIKSAIIVFFYFRLVVKPSCSARQDPPS